MDPTQRQTAEGILFTDVYQRSLTHLYLRMGLDGKQAQIGRFFHGYPGCNKQERVLTINPGQEWLLDWLLFPGEQTR